MTRIALYFHTLRYLLPIQIVGRLWFQIVRPRPRMGAAPAMRPCVEAYRAPIPGEATLVEPHTFRFLGLSRTCAEARDWQPSGPSKLWIYNLHYFDDLNARDADARGASHRRLLERWIDENRPFSEPGWAPYPTSLRIVNWVKWALRGNRLSPKCRHSLAVQLRWLSCRLEHHIQGNHLFANAKALLHGGLYFAGAEAEGWFGTGYRLIEQELRKQVLDDGGHFERSPMYHALFLEDLLDAINVTSTFGRDVPESWPTTCARMLHWLRVMTHPDGELSFFNDAAFGISPTADSLADYAKRVDPRIYDSSASEIERLDDSGYIALRRGRACLFCDCGRIGPDHLPAHAHADSLSFELSLKNERLFVNSGISQYGADNERQRQRGTAAHNTVCVDGADSSEVWGAFRVARRAVGIVNGVEVCPARIVVEASHDGYRRLRGRVIHHRSWILLQGGLTIVDRLNGLCTEAEACFHLHPRAQASLIGEREILLRSAAGLVCMRFEGAQYVRLLPGTWHPEFGKVVPNQRVVAGLRHQHLKTMVSWSADHATADS